LEETNAEQLELINAQQLELAKLRALLPKPLPLSQPQFQPFLPPQPQHIHGGSSDDRKRERPIFRETQQQPQPFHLPKPQYIPDGSSDDRKRERPIFRGSEQQSSNPQNVTPSRYEPNKKVKRVPSDNITVQNPQQQYLSASGGYTHLPPQPQHLPVTSTSFHFQPPQVYSGYQQYPTPYGANLNFNVQQPTVIDPQQQTKTVANSIWEAACNLYNTTYKDRRDLRQALFNLRDPMLKFIAFPNNPDYDTISKIFATLKNWRELQSAATEWEKEWNNLRR
jgi:hypothetical protein